MNMKTAACTTSSERAKSRFVLTRKNQKGQVAIFVALIFQVIFVFFALLINVGLLVHHKINLQQSTDLAAYYGAMKQAEVMNTIAHVNYQIKQAWKLLTWRYRVLGTFGFTQSGENPRQKFPFEPVGGPPARFVYNRSGDPLTKCAGPAFDVDGEQVGIQDVPFFCIGHAGFDGGWVDRTESNCQSSCRMLEQAPRRINSIPLPAIGSVMGENTGITVRNALINVNTRLQDLCTNLGPRGAEIFAKFLSAYISEMRYRNKTIELLARDLSLAPEEILDLEGKKILDGSIRTFRKNLTEANLKDFDESSDFLAMTGFSENQCSFQDGRQGGTEWLKKIEINFINYFIHQCQWDTSGGSYSPQSVYDTTAPGGTALGSAFDGLPADKKDIILSLLVPGQGHTLGYEKNPHCVEYYAVRASVEPNIPFLPLKKIKLHAIAMAKPFGGSIGPWYGKQWPRGSPSSVYTDTSQASKMDETLPYRSILSGAGAAPLKQSVYAQPNFSLYVGDKLGLRETDYIAAFHSALATRDIANVPGKSYLSNINPDGVLSNNNGGWPSIIKPGWDWAEIDNTSAVNLREYDSLAKNTSDSGTRVLEIAAIAPNQFDLTHYSIDPDFYNNYYRKLYAGFDDIRDATGVAGFTKNQLRADFGAVDMDADDLTTQDPLSTQSFSVKDQILMKNIAFDRPPSTSGGPPGTYAEIHSYLVSLQSSLLTGWTFLNFADYATFPGDEVNNTDKTMSFGQCFDAWNKTEDAEGDETDTQHFRTPMNINSENPPAAGNCVTGGRTGYSVKLISPVIVRDPSLLENPIDDAFFNF